jgi:hypothetical protein
LKKPCFIGLRFSKHAPMQKALVSLLQASPLPWTSQMLCDWFGFKGGQIIKVAHEAHRIWRMEYGMYTAIENRPCECEPVKREPPKRLTIVTDDMLTRYGFNL